ncbi:hypothetical protein E4631_18850 [Hymenobacter sp. UV11]|uniref:hypothetical protein n=1 Tax=Hymenobacter sp. UV11 TaxID=1849735 RepID=UPI00105FE446|nr:hypothetical protein [Hymenobacter sp. UV11]TDN36471.1 hypothetical protein A8B98_08950 [Hymenobacter sp. UV11]TFZ64575.1 hypothetical protein E4631_18850 [Hymenobacter sp. UV11]
MKTVALLLAVALLPAAPSFAQTLAAAPGNAQAVSLRATSLAPAYYTRSVAGGGSITYFGAVCSHDAADAQFAQLRQAFATSRPTVVFYQNPDGGLDSTETATIARLGEGGYARFLARQYQVPAERLDDPLAEYAYLQTKLDPERLKLYCLLRETQRYRMRTGASAALTKQAMRQLIANSAHFLPGTAQVIRTEAELVAAYRRYCPAGPKWWQAPADWFAPQAANSDNAFLREANAAVLAYREQQVYGRLLAHAQAGERVLVVMGRAELPAPTPTLARN